MPWLRPYGRPEVGRPVVVSGSTDRTAAETPSPMAWPRGRGSEELVGCDSRFVSVEVVVGFACEQAAGFVTEAEVGKSDTDATREREERASSGTVAVSRTKLPNRWTDSMNRPVKDSA
jgi:hypothetical protein